MNGGFDFIYFGIYFLKYCRLQQLSNDLQQKYKKHIVNIQQMCLYNINTIIVGMHRADSQQNYTCIYRYMCI